MVCEKKIENLTAALLIQYSFNERWRRLVAPAQAGEESPDSVGRDVPVYSGKLSGKRRVWKVPQKQTAAGVRLCGKGEKAVQETTERFRDERCKANPIRSKIK